jgi:4-amino-4-deoxychorismate lyase
VKREYLETIKVCDGKVYNLAYHQKRYEGVLVEYAQEPKLLQDFIDPPKEGLYRCRLLYNAKEILSVSFHPYKKRSVLSLKLIDALDLEYAKKYADRSALDALFEKREGCDDILMVKNGFVRDTSIANIALLKDGIWYTPKEPLLRGTTRERLLDEGKIVEDYIGVDTLDSFESIALMNAMIDFDIIQNKSVEEVVC